jgi:hypothetical protein
MNICCVGQAARFQLWRAYSSEKFEHRYNRNHRSVKEFTGRGGAKDIVLVGKGRASILILVGRYREIGAFDAIAGRRLASDPDIW